MDNIAWTSYDEVPYPSAPFAQTHPDHLATLATLFGMCPPPIERCHVLELGCASGGNLIPMALGLPHSEFVGIDLSARQLAEGQNVVEALGLENIALKQLNILDMAADFGQFDYIIAHGVYSWVSAAVQTKILAICKHHLTPNGVAYVSYNTYPGWYMRGMMRDILLYHTQRFTAPQTRIAQARALLGFLAEVVPAENNAYGLLLQNTLEQFSQVSDAFVFHEYLEEVNIPVSFSQFVAQAAHHGLQYLAEAEFRTMQASHLPPPATEILAQLGPDVIAAEQYLDFLRNRMFRQILLCHDDIPLQRQVPPEQLAALQVAALAQPVSSPPDVDSTTDAAFRLAGDATVSTGHPVTKAAFLVLGELWPQAIPFFTLLDMAYARLSSEGVSRHGASRPSSDAAMLGTNLFAAFSSGLLELHVHAPQFALEASARPVASPLARLQAGTGAKITTLRHEQLQLDEANCRLLCYLDGCHDRAALLEIMAGLVHDGTLEVQQDGMPVTDAALCRDILAQGLEANLRKLARAALLVR